MSGWTYEVTRRRVKERTLTIRAFSKDEAIEFAKLIDKDNGWSDSTVRTEYEAWEVRGDE